MARTKHKTTGNGTHRERIFKARQAAIAYQKAAIQAEKDKIKQLAHAAAQPVEVVDPSTVMLGIDTASPEGDNTVVVELPPTEPAEDGLGHSHEDNSLQDTIRELNGMVANDKHEQLMDTFVEEKTNA
jgi:hypothetical protein